MSKKAYRNNRSEVAGCLILLALSVLCSGPALAAEIIGRVNVQHTGLFTQGMAADVPGGISVSITPLAGQAMPDPQPRSHRVTIQNKAFTPVFMTVRRGDELQFVSHDTVFHKLFSLSKVQPFTLDLGKVEDDGQAVTSDLFTLTQSGPWHVFCRIHSTMYFRVDVVETPYYTMIKDGGEFHFSGLAPGRWQVRVAAIGSEPLVMVAEAITAPPPIQIVLPVKGGQSQAAAGQVSQVMNMSTDGKPEDLQ
jgi:plastocyanin